MTKRPLVGLGVLIFNEDNQILLGKRIASHGHSSWAPPGGHLEFGESFEECAARELEEETGLKIEGFEFVAITNNVFIEDDKHYISVFVKAKLPEEQEVVNLEPYKVEKWEWFGVDDLPDDLFLPLRNLIKGEAYGCGLNNLSFP